jgi:hypothetical protein
VDNATHTLTIHLHSGQTIQFDCAGYDIIQSDDGLPVRLDYTPVDEWSHSLAFVDFRAIAAIEVSRTRVAE